MTIQEKKQLRQRLRKFGPAFMHKSDAYGNPILDGVRGKRISKLISELESLEKRYGDIPIYGFSGQFFPIKVEVEEAIPPERWKPDDISDYEIIDVGWVYCD